MKLLVVEDSRKLQKSLRAGLRRLGYTVDVAGDGKEGTAYAMLGEYDVVVLDLMLPKKSGLEVLRDIRASNLDSSKRPPIPSISNCSLAWRPAGTLA